MPFDLVRSRAVTDSVFAGQSICARWLKASHAEPYGSALARGIPSTPATRTSCSLNSFSLSLKLTMQNVAVPPPSPRRPRRRLGGGQSVDTDLLRCERLNIDLNAAEVALLKKRAAAASLPLRRWARRTLLGTPTPAAQPAELRSLWSSSSTLQSNFNQLCENLNRLHLQDELTFASANQTLRETLRDLAVLAPQLHQLVRQMRVELASLKGAHR